MGVGVGIIFRQTEHCSTLKKIPVKICISRDPQVHNYILLGLSGHLSFLLCVGEALRGYEVFISRCNSGIKQAQSICQSFNNSQFSDRGSRTKTEASARVNTHRHIQTHTHTQAHKHTHTHAHTQTYTHTHARARAHESTHTHTREHSLSRFPPLVNHVSN